MMRGPGFKEFLKIGMVCYPTYGGSGVVATELGKKLAQNGHEVHFISYERPFKLDSFHENVYFHEIEPVEYPLFRYPPYSLVLASKIAEVARTVPLDLVHVHYAIPHTVSAHLAREIAGIRFPIITTLHGTDITLVGNDRQFYDITRFSLMVSDGLTAVSHSLAAETRETFALERHIEVVYNFVDITEYRRLPVLGLREKYARPEEKVLVHISNFRPVKRLPDVIQVFARVNQNIPSKLLLIGDGPAWSEAQRVVNELGLGERVYFLGKQEQVVELLSIADLFLLPSAKESFGLVALEAMACEVPVIGTLCGGLQETVRQDETGFLFPVGDVEGMAQKAVDILANPDRHSFIGEKCRLWAVERFPAAKILGQYEDFYRQFLV